MSIIAWIVVGAIAGIIANLIWPAPAAGGLIGAILLGIVGAVVGGWLGGLIMKRDVTTGINVETVIVSVLGALVVLVVWNMIF
jgi:uncharacterized membrane protein YeaQ/YmgE (transglycosylase-associated protein family)